MSGEPVIGNGTMHDYQAARIRELEEKLADSERQRKTAVTALKGIRSRVKNQLGGIESDTVLAWIDYDAKAALAAQKDPP